MALSGPWPLCNAFGRTDSFNRNRQDLGVYHCNVTPFPSWKHWSMRLQWAARDKNVLFLTTNIWIFGAKSQLIDWLKGIHIQLYPATSNIEGLTLVSLLIDININWLILIHILVAIEFNIENDVNIIVVKILLLRLGHCPVCIGRYRAWWLNGEKAWPGLEIISTEMQYPRVPDISGSIGGYSAPGTLYMSKTWLYATCNVRVKNKAALCYVILKPWNHD